MKKFINALIAGVLAIISVSAMAQSQPDNISGFATDDACLAAVAVGKARAYEPKISRTPGSQYGRMTMHNAGYQNGACVKGLTTFVSDTWVYLPSTFVVGQSGENLVMWKCANAITSISAVPTNQVVNRPAASINFSAAAPLACKGEEECKQVNWCDTNNGWYMSKDGAGNSLRRCDLPAEMSLITKENILRIQEKTTILPEQLPTEVRPWKVAAPVSVPPAPAIRVEVQGSQGPQINMSRQQQGTVSGQSCNTQGCSSRPVANFVSEVKASYCGVRTTDGRLFKLGSATDGSLVVADWTSGAEGRKMRIGGQAAGNDCEVAQAAVEKTHWAGMTQYFGLPNGCAVTQRHTGMIAKN